VVLAELPNAIRKVADPKSGYVSAAVSKYVASLKKIPTEGLSLSVLFAKMGVSRALVWSIAVELAEKKLAAIVKLRSNKIAASKSSLKFYNDLRQQAEKQERQLAAKAKFKVQANDNNPKKADVQDPDDDWKDTPPWPRKNK
jgi:hypothetical protein